jgi:hypothetical protein
LKLRGDGHDSRRATAVRRRAKGELQVIAWRIGQLPDSFIASCDCHVNRRGRSQARKQAETSGSGKLPMQHESEQLRCGFGFTV